MDAAASIQRPRREGTRKVYVGLDEGITHEEEEEAKVVVPRKRGRPPGSGKKLKEVAGHSSSPVPKRGRPPKVQPPPTPLRPLEPPKVGDEQLSQWRDTVAALPDDSTVDDEAAPSAPSISTDIFRTPPDSLGYLLQVHYFLCSFADVLSCHDQMMTDCELDLHALDEAMADGDHPIVHRVHVAVVSFLAKATREAARTADSAVVALPGEFTQLNPDIADQLLHGLRVHGAWPEMMRLVARELRYEDHAMLCALSHKEYRTIGLAARLQILAFLCDAAVCTLHARQLVEARRQRIHELAWDWESARAAGLVQHTSLQELPRPESLGHDRAHCAYWRGAPLTVLRQLLLEKDVAKKDAAEKDVAKKGAAEKDATEKDAMEKDAAEKDATEKDAGEEEMDADLAAGSALSGACLSGSFEVIEGEELLQQVRASMNTKGSRECALGCAISNLLTQRDPVRKFPMPPASATAHPPRAELLDWPMVHKSATQICATSHCTNCNRKMPHSPREYAEHLCMACPTLPAQRPRAWPSQRAAMQLLAIELQLPALLMRHSWGSEREAWRTALVRVASEPDEAAHRMVPFLLELHANIHPALFKPGWARDATSDESQRTREQLEPSRVVLRLDVWARNSGRVQVRAFLHTAFAVGMSDRADGNDLADPSIGRQVEGDQGDAMEVDQVEAEEEDGKKGREEEKEEEEEGEEEGEEEDQEEEAEGEEQQQQQEQKEEEEQEGQKEEHMEEHMEEQMEEQPQKDDAGEEDDEDNTPLNVRLAARKKKQYQLPSAAAERQFRSKDGAARSTAESGGASALAVGQSREMSATIPDTACQVCGLEEDDDSSLLCDGCDKCYHIYCLPRPLIEIPSDDWYCSACSDAHARSVDLPYRVGCELRYRTEPGIWATGIAESMGPKGVRLHCPSAYNDVGDDWVPVDSGRLKPAVKKADEQEEFFAYEYDDSCMVCSHHKLKSWRLGSFIPTLTSMAITVSLSVCFLTPPPPTALGLGLRLC